MIIVDVLALVTTIGTCAIGTLLAKNRYHSNGGNVGKHNREVIGGSQRKPIITFFETDY